MAAPTAKSVRDSIDAPTHWGEGGDRPAPRPTAKRKASSGLELPGIARIDHPHEARHHARAWSRAARDAPPEEAAVLRQHAAAAHGWARRQEDALQAGQQAHDEVADNVTPIKPGGADAPQQRGHIERAARAAGHAAYSKARPPALRIARNGKQHFFQGLQEPFGPTGDAGELVMWALGATLAVVLITDLLKAPGAIVETASHTRGFLSRVSGLADPFTGLTPAAPPRPVAAGSAARKPAAAVVGHHPGPN